MFCKGVRCVTYKVKLEEPRVLYSCEVCDWQGKARGVSCSVKL